MYRTLLRSASIALSFVLAATGCANEPEVVTTTTEAYCDTQYGITCCYGEGQYQIACQGEFGCWDHYGDDGSFEQVCPPQ